MSRAGIGGLTLQELNTLERAFLSAVDVVTVASPGVRHAEGALAALKAGKPVYVEKPLALHHAQAVQVALACRQAGVVLAVGHNRRFLPAVQALIQMAAAGELGQLLHVEGNFSGSFGFDYDDTAWRANPSEAPGGGLTLMGVSSVYQILVTGILVILAVATDQMSRKGGR